MKNILITQLMMFVGSRVSTTHPVEIYNSLIRRDEIIMTENQAIFDLERLRKQESKTVVSYFGDKATITVEKEDINDNTRDMKSINDRTYTISYSTLTENISCKIDIINNLITQVHSRSYSVFGYFVNSTDLKRVSNKRASYVLNCRLLIRSWTYSLNSTITNSNELLISFNK